VLSCLRPPPPPRRLPQKDQSTHLGVSAGSEAGSYLRLIDSCITQLKAQRPSRTCNESKEEEEEEDTDLIKDRDILRVLLAAARVTGVTLPSRFVLF